MAVDIGLTVGLTDLFLSQIIMSSAILSSAHCAVSRASASWSQQSSIVSLSDLTACQETKSLYLKFFLPLYCASNLLFYGSILHAWKQLQAGESEKQKIHNFIQS